MTIRVNIFGVQECGNCLKMKGRVKNLLRRSNGMAKHVEVIFWDQDSVDGRAEGAWHDVDGKLPVTAVERGNRTIARWDGKVPTTDELRLCLETAYSVAAD